MSILIITCILSSTIYSQPAQMKIKFSIFDDTFEGNSKLAVTEMMKLWISTLQKKSKDKRVASAIVDAEFYSSKEELLKNIRNKNFDFINLSVWDYYTYNLEKEIIPSFVGSRNPNSKFEKYYLITNHSTKINRTEEIPINSEIIIPKSSNSNLARRWGMVRLYEKIGKNKFNKISIIDRKGNENQILFSVFFKKAEYAIIHESAFNLACKLNPQVKASIKILDTSDNLLNLILANRKDIDPQVYDLLLQEALKLPNEVEGRQMMEILHLDRTHRLESHDLDPTRDLYLKYNQLFN